ncbi:hypothetical protein JL107_17185 [Nakamurella flavida]|uniref:Glycosyl hydrolases family 39 N-terminal catalytic domain-containing protein n=1 Tax=Nakamurella flavida TaxID=363630 RepID=A0A939C3Y9_9ACTN|nr:hypothetical protein [Nakamurella flavida]MBM9478185.1 hypothetical protein [Nakamurella flavida]MDP9778593.1 xylan 1,4-beta-xylosidase [Nakamurella flavida]
MSPDSTDPTGRAADAAKQDWDARISTRTRTDGPGGIPHLPAPADLRAEDGVAQVTLSWEPVDGAVGYLVHAADTADGPFAPVDHGGQDVLSVPHPPYVDTTGAPGRTRWYAVAAVPEVTVVGELSDPVEATPLHPAHDAPLVTVQVAVDAPGRSLDTPWRPMIGSERLSQLLCTDLSGGREIGVELHAALRRLHDEIGVRTVRAHAIFHDDTNVYREVDGEALYDFSVVDRIYDTVLEIGLRPVVEVGFMPTDLAADPSTTVFEYGAHISPPRDMDRWVELVTRFTRHLIDRYGADEVIGWDFEVWNEANLEVFWSGTKEEWFALYDATARAIKAVDPRIPVGGPSSAAAGWVDDLLAHCRASGAAVDFVSTHTYGSPPLDVRASLVRWGYGDARVLWTEWGVTPTHFKPVNDSVFSAMFLLRGMRSSAGRIEALSYWVASDHFEELGRPPRLLHGGFGLITVGGLAKPRFHALSLLAALGETELPGMAIGDGADSLVEHWATRHEDGRISVLLWNLTLDQSKVDGDAALTRRVALQLTGVADGDWSVEQRRIAVGVGDLVAAAAELKVGDWPTDEQWAELADASAPGVSRQRLTADGGLRLDLELTMPSAVLVELTPPTAA